MPDDPLTAPADATRLLPVTQNITYAVPLNANGHPSAATIDAVATLAQQVVANPDAVSGVETTIVREPGQSTGHMKITVSY